MKSGRPSREEEAALCLRYQSGDASALEELVERNRGFGRWAVKKFSRRFPAMEADFMEQCCWMGFIRAVKAFDPGRGARLSTTLDARCLSAIHEGIYLESSAVQLPAKFWKGERRFRESRFYEAALRMRGAARVDLGPGDDLMSESVSSALSVRDGGQEAVDNRDAVERIFASLIGKHAKEIIRLRFGFEDGECRTLDEIGSRYRISRQAVQGCIADSFARIRSRFAARAGAAP